MAAKPQITGTLVSLKCQSHLCDGHTMQHVWPVSLQNSQEFPAAAQNASIVYFSSLFQHHMDVQKARTFCVFPSHAPPKTEAMKAFLHPEFIQ